MSTLRQPLKFPKEWGQAYEAMCQLPRPRYTCPSCRKDVTRRPIEDLKVKAIVSCLSTVQGIKHPEPTSPPVHNAFDGFAMI